MVQLTVDGKTYKVEFRHVTKLGKRRELYDRSPIKAVTTCVIVADGFIAIDNSICSDLDNFSRREGRNRAFSKVIQHHTPLREKKSELLAEYLKLTGQGPGSGPKKKPKLTDAERQKYIDAGSRIRERRKGVGSPRAVDV